MEFRDITNNKKKSTTQSVTMNGEKVAVEFEPTFGKGTIVTPLKKYKGYSTQLKRIIDEDIPCVVVECRLSELGDTIIESLHLEPLYEDKVVANVDKHGFRNGTKIIKSNILENPFLVEHFKIVSNL